MKQRVFYGAAFAAIAVFCVVFNVWTRVLFLAVCGAIACHEMRNALGKIGYRIPKWFSYASYIVCCALVAVNSIINYTADTGIDTVRNYTGYVFPAFVVLVVALFCQLILKGNIGVKDVLAALGMCGYPLCSLVLLVHIAGQQTIWAAIMLNSIMPACVCDMFALFGGRCFGKHKLCPHISPKKTVEGLISGLIMGAVSGLPVHVILGVFSRNVVPLWAEVVGALLASLAGALGDLAASAIKREAGIKDYSNLIPTHGGMMDRVDSIIFAAPVVYMLYALFI